MGPRPEKLSRLVIDLSPGERIAIDGEGGPALVEFVHKSGRIARLNIIAPASVRVKKEAADRLPGPVPSMAESVPS